MLKISLLPSKAVRYVLIQYQYNISTISIQYNIIPQAPRNTQTLPNIPKKDPKIPKIPMHLSTLVPKYLSTQVSKYLST